MLNHQETTQGSEAQVPPYPGTAGSLHDWIVCPTPRPKARVRLLCFHYAGGNASLFQNWPDYLSPDIEVCAVQLPGRGNRSHEAPYTQLSAFKGTLTEVLGPCLTRPFALFGYSMGALVAFEFARELRRQHLPTPHHVFVAARRAPQAPPPLNHKLSAMSDADLIAFLREHGATLGSIKAKGIIMRWILRTMRADCKIAETFVYTEEEPLDCPISAFGGLEDPYVNEGHLAGWQLHTRRNFSLCLFEGSHSFLHSAETSVLRVMAQDLRSIWKTVHA